MKELKMKIIEKVKDEGLECDEILAEKIYEYLNERYKKEFILESLNILNINILVRKIKNEPYDYEIESGDLLEFNSAFYKVKGLWKVLKIHRVNGKMVARLGKVGKRGKVLKKRKATRYSVDAGELQYIIRHTKNSKNYVNVSVKN